MKSVELDHVSKSFQQRSGPVPAATDVTLSVAPGEFLCVVGSSGCGKSTLLNLVAGLEKPDRGEVRIGGVPVAGPSRECGMIFQEPPLFPWLNASQNVAFALRMAGLPPRERTERACSLLRTVGLTDFARAWPHELSGGMRQRVALAAALAKDPEILLMDEPFAALDAQTRDELHEELERIWQTTRKTVIFVTHNVREAVRLGERVILMDVRGGSIHREYPVGLPRGRHLEDVDLVRIASVIRDELRAQTGPGTVAQDNPAPPAGGRP